VNASFSFFVVWRCVTGAVLSMALLATSAPARAEVYDLGWPYPPTNLEGYSPRVGPVCNPTNKPGPTRLHQVLSFWFGAPNRFNPNWHISRPCAGHANSYHIEGRALDFYVNADEPRAQAIVNWMLAADEYGNPEARARRWGIIEIIWKDLIWVAGEGWRPCPSCGPHYDHIHFSFSRAGALAQTSWHTTADITRQVACFGGTVTVKYWQYPSGYGPLNHVRLISGPNGAYTSQAALAASPWRVYTELGPTVATPNSPVSAAYPGSTYLAECVVPF
jgi:hypothetical protein